MLTLSAVLSLQN